MLVVDTSDDANPGRTLPQATPEMLAQRKAALEGLRALGGLRDIIPDLAAWQHELLEDRPLPGRD